MTSTEDTLERIRTALADVEPGLENQLETPRDGLPTIVVEASRLHDVLRGLRDGAAFESVTFITAVDRQTSATTPEGDPRFEVVHQLQSIAHADRVRIRTRVRGEAPSVPTCTDLWPGASFMERECWDLLGIRFDGHPDLRRLMLPEEYGHHPLRKDFPQEGIDPGRLYREWDLKRRQEEAASRS